MSAFRLVVVEASRPLPSGPTAMLRSPPSLTSLFTSASTALSLITVNTTSETCPPICRPMLPAASV